MSHYAVAVFSDDGDFDRLLAPYNEQDKQYFVFHPYDYQQIIEDFKKFRRQNPKWTLAMYMEGRGYVLHEGEWGQWFNPDGHWDFYTLDGKDYLFELKPDAELEKGRYDYRKNDYDWFAVDEDAAKDAEEFWDTYVDSVFDTDDQGIWNRQYYLDRFKTKKQYVKEVTKTIPYAFITPDGKWHAPGNVGYFGTSDETAEDMNEYIKEWDAWICSDANPYVNLVDCHI